MRVLWLLALRNVLRNRRRSINTLLALVVAVGAMVAIRGFLDGLQGTVVTNVTDSMTGMLQVHRRGFMKSVVAAPLSFAFDVAEVDARVRADPRVVATTPRIQFGAMTSSGDVTAFAMGVALEPRRELEVCPQRGIGLTHGSRFVGGSDGRDVVLTVEAAQAIGLQREQEIILLGPDRDGALSGESARVGGTFVLAVPGERKVVWVPLALAQSMLKLEGQATELVIRADAIASVEDLRQSLATRLGEAYEVHTWREVAPFVEQVMTRQNVMSRIVSVGFMLLMLLGVANTMLMSVLERTREIGTMLSVGVRRGQITALFVYEAALLGSVGALGGVAVGTAVVTWLGRRGVEIEVPFADVPFLIRPTTDPRYLALVVVIAVAGAVLSSLYPARRASRLRPVEALGGS